MSVAFTILVVLIILAAILLIAVVLLQNGKDGGLATNFTSANQALGVRQTATILEKATWYLVAFILVLSIASTLMIGHGSVSGSKDSMSKQILDHGASSTEQPDFAPNIFDETETATPPTAAE